jgi:hypothetical protein
LNAEIIEDYPDSFDESCIDARTVAMVKRIRDIWRGPDDAGWVVWWERCVWWACGTASPGSAPEPRPRHGQCRVAAPQEHTKLRRALNAEIDETPRSSLYSPVSRPYDPPSIGKIALKVIGHYGDDMLRVYEALRD